MIRLLRRLFPRRRPRPDRAAYVVTIAGRLPAGPVVVVIPRSMARRGGGSAS